MVGALASWAALGGAGVVAVVGAFQAKNILGLGLSLFYSPTFSLSPSLPLSLSPSLPLCLSPSLSFNKTDTSADGEVTTQIPRPVFQFG